MQSILKQRGNEILNGDGGPIKIGMDRLAARATTHTTDGIIVVVAVVVVDVAVIAIEVPRVVRSSLRRRPKPAIGILFNSL